MLYCREDVLDLTKYLVSMNSIVNTHGESVIAHALYSLLSSHPYFSDNPSHLTIEQTTNDHHERYNVLAFVKGTKAPSNRTVVLMGHMDTVGVDDFNKYHEEAFQPDEWMETLKEEVIPDTVKEQLNSGDWLFGRGVLDMKSGVSSNMYLLEYYAEYPEELSGNLVFIAECDEEDGSHGILSAIKTLKEWQLVHGFEYVAAINADFVAPRYEGDPNRYIYKGTAGKLLPTFYITGTETHVGACFEGLDPNYIAAELTKQINYNPDLCDYSQGEITAPPVSLKQTDLKPTYSAQTALSALTYYNFFIHSWSPKEVLEKLKDEAKKAYANAMETYNQRFKAFCDQSGDTYEPADMDVRVFDYEELEQLLIHEYGNAYTSHMNAFKQDLLNDDTLDTRLFSIRVVEEAWKWMPTKEPTIILFYSSLYSPRVEVNGKTNDERHLLNALEEAINTIQPAYRHPIVTKPFFPYISDMSFVAISDDEEGIQAVKNNNPGWGTKHYVSYEDVRDLNIPVINVGPYGMDAHSKLERMEMTYSMEILPNLTKEVIENVLNRED